MINARKTFKAFAIAWLFILLNYGTALVMSMGVAFPLHEAVINQDSVSVGVLLGLGVDPNAQNEEGETPLHFAVILESEVIVNMLLQRGASTSIVDNDGITPLSCWADARSNNSLSSLLFAYGAATTINSANRWGQTALHRAVISLDQEVIATLIAHGATVSGIVDNEGHTPLHLTFFESGGYEEDALAVARMLLDAGAVVDINRHDNDGDTPLLAALREVCDFNIIELLIQRGANVNLANSVGDVPLALVRAKKARLLAYRVINLPEVINVNRIENLLLDHGARAPQPLNRRLF